MVARIIYSPSLAQLKVSRPGYDVNSAPLEQMAFTSVGDPYAGVYLTGESSALDGTWTTIPIYSSIFGAVAFVRNYKVIPLGRTFRSPPQVIWTLRDVLDPTGADYAKYGFFSLTSFGGALAVTGLNCWASCSTTELTLRIDHTSQFANPLKWRFAYMVFQT